MIETAGFGDLDMARLAVLQLQPRNVVLSGLAQHPILMPECTGFHRFSLWRPAHLGSSDLKVPV